MQWSPPFFYFAVSLSVCGICGSSGLLPGRGIAGDWSRGRGRPLTSVWNVPSPQIQMSGCGRPESRQNFSLCPERNFRIGQDTCEIWPWNLIELCFQEWAIHMNEFTFSRVYFDACIFKPNKCRFPKANTTVIAKHGRIHHLPVENCLVKDLWSAAVFSCSCGKSTVEIMVRLSNGCTSVQNLYF